mgnify:CR=1 FL=1
MLSGLFWYLLYIKHGVGTWSSELDVPRWRVDHFWGPGKPWRNPFTSGKAKANYVQRLMLGQRPLSTRQRTFCTLHLHNLWQWLIAENKSMINDSPGWSPVSFPVLPRPQTMHTFRAPKAHSCPRMWGQYTERTTCRTDHEIAA